MVTAEEIRSRTFVVSLRGFDREEVKGFLAEVAEALEAAQQRVRALEAEAGAAAVAQATSALEAGSDRDAATSGDGGPDGGTDAVAGTGGEQASPFAQLGAETQRILEAAQEAGEQIRRRAQADAERELKGARAQAARIIAEGERSREETERVVEALTGARAELAEDLRDVGRTIERVLRELGPAAPAATVREAVVEAARADAADAADAAPAARPDGKGDEPGTEAEVADAGVAEAGVADAGVADAGVAEAGVAEAGIADAGIAEAGVPGGEAEEPGRDAGAEAAGGDRDAARPVEEPLAASDPAAASEPLAAEEPAGDDQAESVDDRAGSLTAAAAVRGERSGSASNASGAVPAGIALDAGAPVDPASAATNGDRGEPPDGPQQRTGALSPLHARLVRKLKRGLQDLQNATLDTLRRDPNRTDVEPFLPDETAVRALAALAEDQLARAHAAGIAAASEAAGAEVALAPSGRALADQLGSELGGVLVTRLADTLRAGFDARQGMTALTERVDAVFTRIKSGPAGDVASVALVRAYEGGRKDAWAASGVTHRRWVRASEPPCTDARCVDNESAGAVPVGERFPSRHDAPPVRPGCHCSTAPAGG